MSGSGILTFAGHMIDRHDRESPRFPSYAENAVRLLIAKAIAQTEPSAVVCSAACGGDIIFAEEALRFGAQLYLIMPFESQVDFLYHSVAYAGSQWVERFHYIFSRATQRPYYVRPSGYTSDQNFEDNQRAMTFFALGLAAAQSASLSSLVLCDPDQLGHQIGGTGSFLQLCRESSIPYSIIDIARLRSQEDSGSQATTRHACTLSLCSPQALKVSHNAVTYSSTTLSNTSLFQP